MQDIAEWRELCAGQGASDVGRSEQRGGECALLRNAQEAPPAAQPPLPCNESQGGRRALCAEPDELRDQADRLNAPAPSASQARTHKRCGPGRSSSGYAARLRRSATAMAAPSREAAEGWALPSRVRGDTSVTLQHKASPSGVAPYTTKSRRRRSAESTPGADVRASHCCGTTWPSGPTASRAMRTQACSRGFARRASRPVRGHAAW